METNNLLNIAIEILTTKGIKYNLDLSGYKIEDDDLVFYVGKYNYLRITLSKNRAFCSIFIKLESGHNSSGGDYYYHEAVKQWNQLITNLEVKDKLKEFINQ